MANRSSNPLDIRITWSRRPALTDHRIHLTTLQLCTLVWICKPCEPGYVSAKIIQADLFEWLLVFSNLNFELVQSWVFLVWQKTKHLPSYHSVYLSSSFSCHIGYSKHKSKLTLMHIFVLALLYLLRDMCCDILFILLYICNTLI